MLNCTNASTLYASGPAGQSTIFGAHRICSELPQTDILNHQQSKNAGREPSSVGQIGSLPDKDHFENDGMHHSGKHRRRRQWQRLFRVPLQDEAWSQGWR
jgi:hypothetical protein